MASTMKEEHDDLMKVGISSTSFGEASPFHWGNAFT